MEDDIIDQIAGKEEEIPQDDDVQAEVPEQPEAEIEEVTEPEPEKEPEDSQVPLAALHEERGKRQELQSRLDETIQKMGKMEALWEQIQQPKEQAPELPDYEEDPAGHLQASIQAMQQKLEAIEGKSQQQEEQQKQSESERQMLERYTASVSAFSREHNDFNDAYQYLADAVDKELQARGYDDPLERANMLQYEEGLMVGKALQSGKDPAEQIYNYAKFRGFGGQAANGEDEDKLERIEKGARAAQTLNGPSGSPEPPPTLERLAELADADPKLFDQEWEKARRSGLLG